MLIFNYNFGNSSVFQYLDNFFQQFMTKQQTNMLHANIQFAQQSMLYVTCKHSFCSPICITMIGLSLEFTRHEQAQMNVTCAKSFILSVLSICLMHVMHRLQVL